jgi:hypothetical protein
MNSIRPSQAYIDESRAASLLEKWAPVLDYCTHRRQSHSTEHSNAIGKPRSMVYSGEWT